MAKKGGNPQNLKPFPKGVSGNPEGRPKTVDLTELMDSVGGEEGLKNTVKALFQQAKSGNVNAIKEVLDRYYGKTIQRNETDLTTGGQPFNLRELIGFKSE